MKRKRIEERERERSRFGNRERALFRSVVDSFSSSSSSSIFIPSFSFHSSTAAMLLLLFFIQPAFQMISPERKEREGLDQKDDRVTGRVIFLLRY